jgi:hypothetical protein
MSGSTVFIPVCDVSRTLITLIAQFVDPELRRYAPPKGGWNIVDDRRGFRSAGAEQWLKRGFLDSERISLHEILQRLGFRIATPGLAAFGNPIGLDGVFEARCPPYGMDTAVDSVLAPQSPKENPATVLPHLMCEAEHREGTITISDEGLACTKAICNYVFDSYGRFPAGTDAMHLMWLVQAHHIDTDFYDRFFAPGVYGLTHASHMATWHPEVG